MKTAFIVFALRDKLREAGDTKEVVYGQHVVHGDAVGYLYEDRLYPGSNDPPCPDLTGRAVFLLQHMSGSANHHSQRQWIAAAKPRIVFRRPPFMHDGDIRLMLRRLFVEGEHDHLRLVSDELFRHEAIDLLEQTLTWNALIQALPERTAQRDAQDKRDELAERLTLAFLIDENLASLGLEPQAWDSRLRARVSDIVSLML